MICNNLHPGVILILVGLALPFLSKRLYPIVALLATLLVFAIVINLNHSQGCEINYLNLSLQPLVIDNLSRLFLIVFSSVVFVTCLFCFRQVQATELSPAFIYAGAAMSVIAAGDLITIFVFWEIMALASTWLIWSAGSKQAQQAGIRYILVHLLGGVLLMSGIAGYYFTNQSIAFETMELNTPFTWLIFSGFLLNAGAPPFSAWIADAYPETSFAGMVFLSAFTTKTAVYVLLRGFPGTELLIWVGLFMIFYGIIYALSENDMRRILAYSIVNQVGFMICGIGIGTELSLNGTIAHACASIIYKALLLMSAGSVLYMTGKRKCTDLGGLVQSMPITAICCIIGALAISSFPLTSGFISKSMLPQAAADQHFLAVWLLLQAAAAGVFLQAGIKFPWLVFFQKDSGLRPSDPPWNMRAAMILLAFMCVLPGLVPELLYNLLPSRPDYEPYTADHVLAQLQLLFFSGLAFFILLPWMKRTLTISLDFDWFYRRLFPMLLNAVSKLLLYLWQSLQTGIVKGLALQKQYAKHYMPPFLISTDVLVCIVLLGISLSYYLW